MTAAIDRPPAARGLAGLRRPAAVHARVPITPMVDIVLILLFFFIVTSSFLDLDRIPMSETAEQDAAPAPTDAARAAPRPVLLRLAPSGAAVLQGRETPVADLPAALADALAARPGAEVLILPAGAAPAQALVDAVGAAAAAGAGRVRVLRAAEDAP